MSVPLADIKEFEAAFDFVMDQLALFIKDVLPNHALIRADLDLTVPTTEYVSVRPLTGAGMNPSGYGNDHIYYEQNSVTGDETYVYQYFVPVFIKVYKGSAFSDANRVRQGFKNKTRHYNFFGNDQTIGVTNFTVITNDPTPIDDQTMQPGATFNVTLSFLAKEVSTSLGSIERVDGTVTTKSDSGDYVKDFSAEFIPPP